MASGSGGGHEHRGTTAAAKRFSNSDKQRQKTSSLLRGIQSDRANIARHREKINHPERLPYWSRKSTAEKLGLIRHWEKEIRTFEKNITDAENELRRRGK